jgi:hypothetical protein
VSGSRQRIADLALECIDFDQSAHNGLGVPMTVRKAKGGALWQYKAIIMTIGYTVLRNNVC